MTLSPKYKVGDEIVVGGNIEVVTKISAYKTEIWYYYESEVSIYCATIESLVRLATPLDKAMK